MAVDKIQLLENDLDSINNGLQGLHERFNNFLLTDAFGQVDVEIDGATTFTTISIASPGLLGPIPNDSIFTLTHPDGSFAVTIRNEKATIPKGATSIVIYVDGNQPGDQVVDTYFGFPPGSLVSAPGYNQGDSTYAAGNNTDVQFNTNGRLDGDSSFTYDISTTKLTTPNIEVSGVIDGDIYSSDGTSKVLENGTDGTDATFTGDVTGDLTGTADIADKVKVASSTASTSKYIPFVTNLNDADASLQTKSSLKFQPNIGSLTATRMNADKFVGDIYASNSSSKILDNGTTGADATITADVTNVQGTTILDVSTPQLNAAVVGNVTGNVTGNADTATKIASITNANIVQLTDTQTLTNKTLTSPTLTTPTLGTPSSGDLTNCTFPTLDQDTTGNAATATKIASITNANIVQLTDTQTLTNKTLTDCDANTQAVGDNSTKVATTEFVQANTGKAAGSAYNVQFADQATGDLAGATLVNYVPAGTPYLTITSELRVGSNTGTNVIKFNNLPTTAQTNVVGIDSNGQLYEQAAGTGGGSPGGPNYSVQFNDSLGGFDGESSFTYSPTNNTLSCANIDSSFSGSYGDIKGKLKGDNIGTGIYATGPAKYWYLTPYDFLGATSGSGILTSSGNYMMMPSSNTYYMVSIQIPAGYKLVKVFIKGNVANAFSVQASSWSSIYGASFGSGTVNTELTLSTPVNSTEGNYITLSINPSGSYNRIYGARLTLEEI
jgi:hypothetical protein